jgi:2-polyprenyl-3-methyl-5-hydroxy-6-metoxy-1,4-benzoquinol methylase
VDLSERSGSVTRRHPWETARVTAIQKIVAGLGLERPRVLDVGSGDGYLVQALHGALRFADVVAQDIHLTDALVAELRRPGVEFVRELTDPHYRADLILLMDVLEHVEGAVEFLAQLARERLSPEGRIVITVPAFQLLFTDHDRALKHFRRYDREELIRDVESAGLAVLDSGYLFASLLPPRALSALRERLWPRREASHGVGSWQGPALVTQLLHGVLALDGRLCLAARERGVIVPGLTVWLTCKTQS